MPMPRVRDVVGPQYATHGVVAKQPGTNSQYRKLLLEQRKADDLSKATISATKDVETAKIKDIFERRTEKRNNLSRIKVKVEQGLQAAEEDLDVRRNRLKEMLLQEETALTREYVVIAQQVEKKKFEEAKMRLMQLELKKEAETKALAEEKRVQQFRARCEELRIEEHKYNRKLMQYTHELQMEEKRAKLEAEKELDLMHHHLVERDVQAMKEYEDRLAREREARQKEIAAVYERQKEGRKLMEEEEKRLKKEEALLIEKMKEQLEQERQEEMEKERSKKNRMREEMREQLKQSQELLERRKGKEKEMENTFCRLINDELDREKAAVKDNRRQLRRELDLFTEHLQRMKKEQAERNKELHELTEKEAKKIHDQENDVRCQEINAKEELRKEVMRQRELQIQCKARKAEAELEMKRAEEVYLAHQFDVTRGKEEEEKRSMAERKKCYAMELKQQQEEMKLRKDEERRAEERKLLEEQRAEEEYLHKVRQQIAARPPCIHPFARKLGNDHL